MQRQPISYDPKVPTGNQAVAGLGHVRGDAVVGLGEERGHRGTRDGGGEDDDDVGCCALGAPADGTGGVAGMVEDVARGGFGAGVDGRDVQQAVWTEGDGFSKWWCERGGGVGRGNRVGLTYSPALVLG